MTKRIALVTLLALAAAAIAAAQQLPFTLSLGDAVTIPKAPKLQSFASAQAGGKWLLIGGRTAGLHTFYRATPQAPRNNFPPEELNELAWVIDPAAQQVWSAKLPDTVRPWLTMTNGQSEQDGDTLYIAGGYGLVKGDAPFADADNMRTFDTLTAVKVSATIAAIVNGRPLDGLITQIHDPRVAVTGGELRKLGDFFYLVFGQQFDGLYSPDNTHANVLFRQTYTERIGRFQITASPLAIANYSTITSPAAPADVPAALARPFHRRDLNVAPAILPDGTPALVAYGGVFVPGEINAFRRPVAIQGTAATSDPYEQFMSQYNCALVPMYSPRARSMYTTFFGGISLYYMFPQTRELKRDNGLPFIRNITTLARNASGSSECISTSELPGYMGAGATFFAAPKTVMFAPGIVNLDRIRGRTLIGWIYGGIVSSKPHTGADDAAAQITDASAMTIPVYVENKAANCTLAKD
jgi:hypothetical protein